MKYYIINNKLYIIYEYSKLKSNYIFFNYNRLRDLQCKTNHSDEEGKDANVKNKFVHSDVDSQKMRSLHKKSENMLGKWYCDVVSYLTTIPLFYSLGYLI